MSVLRDYIVILQEIIIERFIDTKLIKEKNRGDAELLLNNCILSAIEKMDMIRKQEEDDNGKL